MILATNHQPLNRCHDKRCLVTQAKCPEVNECALYDMAIPMDEKGRCVLSE